MEGGCTKAVILKLQELLPPTTPPFQERPIYISEDYRFEFLAINSTFYL